MDNGTLALLLAPLVALTVGVVTAFVTRRNSSDSNNTARFEALLEGYDRRIVSLEHEVAELRDSDVRKTLEIARLSKINSALNKYIHKLVKFIVDNTELEPPQPDDSLI